MKKNILRILSRFNLLPRLNIDFTVSLNGSRIVIPVINGIGLDNIQVSEPWMTDVLKRLLSIGRDGFIDIGVNIGQTFLKLRSLDANIRYTGFEPNPVCVFYVKQLIKKNNYKNSTLIPVAVGANDEIIEFNYFSDNSTDEAASIVKDFRPTEKIFRTEYIPCFSFDSVTRSYDLGKVSIIKIDVEGAELEVFKGIRGVVESQRPFILMEILPVYVKEYDNRMQRQAKIEQLLIELNYKKIRIHKSGNSFLGFEVIDSIGIHSNVAWSDYVLCPSEKMDKVLEGMSITS